MPIPAHAALLAAAGNAAAPPVCVFGTPGQSAQAGTNRICNIPYPAGISANDVLFLIGTRSSNAAWPAVTGFTVWQQGDRGAIWYRLADGSESGNVTWTLGSSNNSEGVILHTRGYVNTAAIVDTQATQASVSSGNIICPTVTPTTSLSLCIATQHGLYAAGTPVNPGGTNPTYGSPLASIDSGTTHPATAHLCAYVAQSTSTSALGNRSQAATGFTNFYHGMSSIAKGV